MNRLSLRRQRGLTLVETLISVALGLLVLGAVLYAYFGSKGSYRLSKSTSRIQEAGHFGLEAMLRDVRSAGFVGCGSRMTISPNGTSLSTGQSIYQVANPPLNVTSTGDALVGYPPASYPTYNNATAGGTTTWPAGAATASPPLFVPWFAGDVLTLRIGTGAPVMMVKDPVAETLYLANNCGRLAQGNYVMLANCSSATVLRASNSVTVGAASCPASPPSSPVVSAGVPVKFDGTGDPGNGGAPYNVNPPTVSSPTVLLTPPTMPQITMQSLATAQQFDEVTYYVGQFAPIAGVPVRPPALYRYSAAVAVDASNQASEEIIDHIENMAITYGVNSGGVVTCMPAATVTAGNLWSSVVSVQITLVAFGDELGAVDNPQTFTLGSCGGAPAATLPPATADTRLRQLFTATAALSDRMP
jgi:type IV pilus assembly protein PilW